MSFEKAFQLGREAAEFTAAFPRRVFGNADASETAMVPDSQHGFGWTRTRFTFGTTSATRLFRPKH
jgi:hypothetical protein